MRCADERAALVLFIVCASSFTLLAQEPCRPPSLGLSPPGPNIFSERQEEELGEVIAQRLRYFRITDDSAVTAYLARVGDRLVGHLPPTQFSYRYFIVDSAAADAFAGPGGRIYVTRGMVAELRSPDEVAALLAHEMGHIVTHQAAVDATLLLRQVLGVTQVTDRQDIQKKLNDLESNWRRNPSAFRQVAHRSEPEQLLADEVGLYAITAAGYSPSTYPGLFDRILNTSGRTGGWLSDLLHTTTPAQLRLREMLKAVQAMPQACISPQPSREAGDFQRWRMAALDFTAWGKRNEDLHGVLSKVKLDPLTLGDVWYIRFSPDGKYLLAEKNRSLYIFTRDPFAFLFRIYAPDAREPRFTADSKSVALTAAGNRVEIWDIASQSRTRIDEPPLRSPCATAMVSPDARTLACLRDDGILDLLQLPSGTLVLEKNHFSEVLRSKLGFVLGTAHMDFSPDGRYFIGYGISGAVAFDVTGGEEIRLPSGLKNSLTNGFTFLSSGRLLSRPSLPWHLASNQIPLQRSVSGLPAMPPQIVEPSAAIVYEFPSAKVIDRIPMGWTNSLAAATHGDYVLVGPLRNHALGIVDLNSKKLVWSLEYHTADVYDEAYAHQTLGRDLGLYDMRTGKLQARATFPPDEDAGQYFGATASPGMGWLASSAGAVWNLGNGKMVYHLRPFQNGHFESEQIFTAVFPAYRDTPRTTVRLDLTQGKFAPVPTVEQPYATQYGPYLVIKKPEHSGRLRAMLNPCHWKYPDFDPMDCDVTAEVRDLQSGRVLWSRHFPQEFPRFRVDPQQGTVILQWAASDAAVVDEIKNYRYLADDWAARKPLVGTFLEILSLSDGSVRRAMLLDSGAIINVRSAGERLLVSRQAYIEVFSLDTGEKEGEIPGSTRAISPSGRLIDVSGDARNELDIYDLQSRERLDHFAFPADVELDQFSSDAKRLLVLTNDQIAYFLDMTLLLPSGSDRP